ncbi:alpha-N-arabinofuranosidase [Streptomyces sulfonofaciens]|uniref:non-reducing end alpha-L-arabinofuranosidase n=1 Tax=Streptomyces sulfonofaciens TaxID=68272 RepID=A0A919FTC0_9ACTN|nr:alpha-N-arabinofuranosidase [Streptomyces sulfonofaciens]GHH71688.1 alpha-N-arabinofuranosidase [Streptomyces sulfonofaciens]
MSHARLVVDPAFVVGEVDPRLYGSFVEHLGRCVYGGIYEPEHPTADEHGFRGDVADLVTGMGVPILRYPGGNFVSGYRWEDGIGPRESRPTRLNLPWKSIESNAVGTDEFCTWSRRVGSEPMLAVNLGTRGADAAARLVEYCNHPGGTYWSDLRRKNGAPDPHAVKVWCLGNEMDGPWQVGHKTADEYGRLAAQAAQAMRLVDPDIELVACGSSGGRMPTFPEWDATTLEHCYEHVDYISLHSYYQERKGDRASFLACTTDMDRYIDAVVATADYVRAKGRHTKRVNLSLDEWNVWYSQETTVEREWERAPRLIEDQYNLVDAVVVGNMLISLLRHADRVRIACLAQLVNAIGAIRAEPGGPAWPQTTFHPFALTSRYGRGVVLQPVITSPTYETAWFGEVPVLDAVAVRDDGSVTVFAVNRDQHETLPLTVDLRAVPRLRRAAHTYIGGADPLAANTEDEPGRVVPRTGANLAVDAGELAIALPPLSWNMIRIS